jgi:hypothetical protein
LACATALFWGGYLLMRRVFDTGMAAATLVGGLLMFNGFMPHRLLIGHVGFHGFALVPWIALLLLMPLHRFTDSLAAAVIAGVLLGYWVHGGFGTLILAGALGVALVAAIHAVRGGGLRPFIARSAVAALVGLGLGAGKLWAGFAFFGNFPRNNYRLPGADGILGTLEAITGALFLPSQWAHSFGNPLLRNVQWSLDTHEWAFNFSFAALLLIVVLVVVALRRPSQNHAGAKQAWWAWLVLTACLTLPFLYNVYTPDWNAFLKRLPILNSASSALRWLIVYIPAIAIVTGLLLEKSGWSSRIRLILAASCLVATALQTAIEPREYYDSQSFDARPLQIADALFRAGRLQPEIIQLGAEADFSAGAFHTKLSRNDTFIVGTSKLFCYNSAFGYGLEKFSAAGMAYGPVLAERDGYLNLKNPACYVFPKENGCQPGDRFRADQLEQAKRFVKYRPFEFRISTGQYIANQITFLTLLAIATVGLIVLLQAIRHRGQQGT